MQRLALVAALLFSVAGGVPAWAHVGFEHFMGKVTLLEAARVEMKTDAGATVAFTRGLATRYLRRGAAVPPSDLAVGSRVVVDARREKGSWIAKEIRFVVEE
jgi:hypothetical protein